MAEPIVRKRCPSCNAEKPASEFYKSRKRPDGLHGQCKECMAAASKRRYDDHGGKEKSRSNYKKYTATPRGAALAAWNRIRSRLAAAARGRQHFRAYLGVEVRMTKEEFIAWAAPEFERWFRERPGVKPSVDRKSSDGHYEAGNLQLIPHPQNSGKAKRNIHLHQNVPAGFKRCGRCKEVKTFDCFRKVKPGNTGTFGLYGWCNACCGDYDRERAATQRRRVQIRARGAVVRALAKGVLVKPSRCQHPGCERADVQAHHHKGYARENWLDVIWLCPPHHSAAEPDGKASGK